MKISGGGGNIEENEEIQVIRVPLEIAKQVLLEDETIQRTADLMFSVLWLLEKKMK